MLPWELLDRTPTPDGKGELGLYRRGTEFVIRAGNYELMSSRAHASEEAMAELTASALQGRPAPHVLIGGLGMGFTLAASNRCLSADAQIEVCELVPSVVAWNRDVLADLAGRPLEDPRVRVTDGDVSTRIHQARAEFDAILLDVDNGPSALTQTSNDSLYGQRGLSKAFKALRDGGVLSVWSAGAADNFTHRLSSARFEVQLHRVHARANHKGPRHCVWIAKKPLTQVPSSI